MLWWQMQAATMSSELTPELITHLARAVTRSACETIALGYLNFIKEEVDNLWVSSEKDPMRFNRSIFETWRNRHFGINHVEVSLSDQILSQIFRLLILNLTSSRKRTSSNLYDP